MISTKKNNSYPAFDGALIFVLIVVNG